jgi:hypothetical protein
LFVEVEVPIHGLPSPVGLAAVVAVIRAKKDDLPDIVRTLKGNVPGAALPAPARSQVAGEDGRSQASRGRAASKQVPIWLGTIATGVLIVVLGALITNYLSNSHPPAPAHRATPNATASPRR